jgi:hypothetical protein
VYGTVRLQVQREMKKISTSVGLISFSGITLLQSVRYHTLTSLTFKCRPQCFVWTFNASYTAGHGGPKVFEACKRTTDLKKIHYFLGGGWNLNPSFIEGLINGCSCVLHRVEMGYFVSVSEEYTAFIFRI